MEVLPEGAAMLPPPLSIRHEDQVEILSRAASTRVGQGPIANSASELTYSSRATSGGLSEVFAERFSRSSVASCALPTTSICWFKIRRYTISPTGYKVRTGYWQAYVWHSPYFARMSRNPNQGLNAGISNQFPINSHPLGPGGKGRPQARAFHRTSECMYRPKATKTMA